METWGGGQPQDETWPSLWTTELPPLCQLQPRKKPPQMQEECGVQSMCFHSNHHHGTRGRDPTSGLAEAPGAPVPLP